MMHTETGVDRNSFTDNIMSFSGVLFCSLSYSQSEWSMILRDHQL